MNRAGWRNRVGLPAVLLTAMITIAATPAVLFAGLRPQASAAPGCSGLSSSMAARGALAAANPRAAGARVQPQLGRRGELTGRVLSADAANGSAISIALPAESFVGDPVGDVIVYTRHSASSGSEVRAVNIVTGCDTRLASPAEIVRSAILGPAADQLYVHSVVRGTRADAGVTRIDLATGKRMQAVPPVRPDAEFGPIFGTELRWSLDGSVLAVQSCGFIACLTRALSVATGKVATYDAPGQGAIIALTSDHLVTFAACSGLPCPVISVDRTTAEVAELSPGALDVSVSPNGSGLATLSIKNSAGSLEVIQ